MFGRVRASSATSLELLESERSSCKIIKHDSLSIYESTLLKLKQGSRCDPRSNPEDSATTDAFCITAIDSPEAMTAAGTVSLSTESHPTSSSGVQSTASSNEEANTNMSILHYFSKHKSAAIHIHDSREKEAMDIESGYSSSCIVSPVSTPSANG